jgi:hypothetical protein
VAEAYLRNITSSPPIDDVVSFYLEARAAAVSTLTGATRFFFLLLLVTLQGLLAIPVAIHNLSGPRNVADPRSLVSSLLVVSCSSHVCIADWYHLPQMGRMGGRTTASAPLAVRLNTRNESPRTMALLVPSTRASP